MDLSLATRTAFPKRTLSGSSFPHLAEDLQDTVTKLEDAKLAAIKAAPHPRDYIHQGEGVYDYALAEFKLHLKTLDELIHFYKQKRDHVLDQMA